MTKYYITNSDYEVILVSDCTISYGKHNHSTKYVIGIVLAGSVSVEDETGKREYYQGEYFVIPPYLVHTVAIYDQATTLLNICIGENFVKTNKILPYTFKENLLELFAKKEIHKEYFSIIEKTYTNLENNSYSEKFKCAGSVGEAHEKIKTLPEEPLNIDVLAELSNMSKYHFIRTFRKSVGLTPHNYQIQNRIRKSQRLLQQGKPIADVAVEMGFFDQSHFIKFFHRVVGITPKEYVDSVVRME